MKQQKQWIAAAVTAALALTLASGALASGAGRHTDAERLEPCRDLSLHREPVHRWLHR